MFWTVLRFEIAYHLKRPVTYLYPVVLFLLTFGALTSDAIIVTGAGGLVVGNSPFALAQLSVIMTTLGSVFTVAIVGTSLLRDYEFKAHELLFTTRMSRAGYLGGRFAGALAVMLLVFSVIPVATVLASFAPWVDPDKFGPVVPWWHIQPFLLFGLTNVLIMSAVFFAVGALTRSLVAVYTSGFALLVAWSLSQSWVDGLDNEVLSNATDVWGLSALSLTTRYWTVAERNSLTVPVEGFVLGNRLLWVAIALVIAGVTMALFRMEAQPRAGWRRKASRGSTTAGEALAPHPALAITPSFGTASSWRRMIATASFSFRHIVKDRMFIAITAIAGVNTFMNAWAADSFYGSTTWPVTYLVAELVGASYFLFMVILGTIFAGESVWRERSLGADQLTDTTPVSGWVPGVGKILGVVMALVMMLAAMIPVGMVAQVFKGYTDFQVGLYLRFLVGTQLPWAVTVVLFSFFVHALVDSKFVGHVVIILYWVGSIVAGSLGVEHRLFDVGWTPGFTYSDMNGFGHYVTTLATGAGYSLSLGLMATVLALLVWTRGTDRGLHHRMAGASARWNRRTAVALMGTAVLVVVFGGAIFYNTNILNDYETSDDRNDLFERWERTYRPFIHLAPPRVVDVDVTVELWPERRAYSLDGRYIVVNKQEEAIDSILTDQSRDLVVERLEWDRPATAAIADTALGTFLWVLDEPLAPGDSMTLSYRFSYDAEGFPNSAPNTRIVANGTFLSTVGPGLGYDESSEMGDRDERRKRDLPIRDRLPDLDDPAARRNSQFSIDSDGIRFAATIATTPSQIALAPGYLQREWEEGGRRWFRYEMDRPMANFAAIVSAEYEVVRDRWNDVDIAIYHHAGHEYNLDRMVAAVKASLDYFSTHFGPYQYRELRILEFPRYASFAQSFATTIPYSEGIGFILKVTDEDDDLDMPFFVTSHEVAHQWWGHQVVGARAQGSALMVESMAEYSALTVMEKRYGASHAQKFLRHELDRYLRGRAGEQIREQPLMRSENQAYIHYNKGALALYALRDYIGEDAMNRALRGYLDAHAYEEAPYSTARDFVAYLEAETPDSLRYVIEDLFETITLWDNRTEDAVVEETGDGRWAVTLDFTSRKVRADTLGNETAIPMNDYVDVGVFGEPEPGNTLGKPLEVRKVHVTEGTTRVRFTVDEEPRRAGVDPYNKLIDRVPGDNVEDVSRGSGPASTEGDG